MRARKRLLLIKTTASFHSKNDRKHSNRDDMSFLIIDKHFPSEKRKKEKRKRKIHGGKTQNDFSNQRRAFPVCLSPFFTSSILWIPIPIPTALTSPPLLQETPTPQLRHLRRHWRLRLLALRSSPPPNPELGLEPPLLLTPIARRRSPLTSLPLPIQFPPGSTHRRPPTMHFQFYPPLCLSKSAAGRPIRAARLPQSIALLKTSPPGSFPSRRRSRRSDGLVSVSIALRMIRVLLRRRFRSPRLMRFPRRILRRPTGYRKSSKTKRLLVMEEVRRK